MARRIADARRMPETPTVMAAPITEEDVRRRAFEIYLGRAGAPGSPEEDWARAERELRGVVR